MIDQHVSTIRKNLHLFEILDESVVLDKVSQKFHFPDEVTSWLLAQLLEGRNIDEAFDILASELGVSTTKLRLDFSDLISSLATVDIEAEKSVDQSVFEKAHLPASLAADVCTLFKCGSQDIVLGFSHLELFNRWCETDPQVQYELLNNSCCDLQLVLGEGGYSVIGVPFFADKIESFDEAALLLRAQAEDVAAKRISDFFVLHAAAVVSDSKALLLPALGGSGKSTLAAGLSAAGFPLIHDDIVPVDSQFRVSSVGQTIKLKPGSWNAISSHFPEASLSDAISFGSTQIKKLLGKSDINSQVFDVKWIVVPQYVNGSEASCESLSPVEAFKLLIAADSLFRLPVAVSEIETLLQWLSGVQCWKITYPDLTSAISLVDDIVSVKS